MNFSKTIQKGGVENCPLSPPQLELTTVASRSVLGVQALAIRNGGVLEGSEERQPGRTGQRRLIAILLHHVQRDVVAKRDDCEKTLTV
ncbi:hypothetical protein KIH39_22055 [Telmatocola sphagniphila]|uniref:Uncharacterized protein n=1 Tax=Telmatocola sphagniphila TaxID=1123043 RepID=A0A8E6B528_9BACT|nr:hypothetical protein [Telmatocola sphagniphila]QVL31502.1 hypothetical protein KIH39_22055 [Telmatocola sphagniphila]